MNSVYVAGQELYTGPTTDGEGAVEFHIVGSVATTLIYNPGREALICLDRSRAQ